MHVHNFKNEVIFIMKNNTAHSSSPISQGTNNFLLFVLLVLTSLLVNIHLHCYLSSVDIIY